MWLANSLTSVWHQSYLQTESQLYKSEEAEAVDVLDEASQVLDKAHQGQEGAFEYIEQHNKLRVCVS